MSKALPSSVATRIKACFFEATFKHCNLVGKNLSSIERPKLLRQRCALGLNALQIRLQGLEAFIGQTMVFLGLVERRF